LDWLEWAIDSGLEAFGKLADTILKHLDPLLAVLDHHVTNARTEGLNTRIRLIARRAFGFRSPDSLIALAKSPLLSLLVSDCPRAFVSIPVSIRREGP
jgi:transposase